MARRQTSRLSNFVSVINCLTKFFAPALYFFFHSFVLLLASSPVSQQTQTWTAIDSADWQNCFTNYHTSCLLIERHTAYRFCNKSQNSSEPLKRRCLRFPFLERARESLLRGIPHGFASSGAWDDTIGKGKRRNYKRKAIPRWCPLRDRSTSTLRPFPVFAGMDSSFSGSLLTLYWAHRFADLRLFDFPPDPYPLPAGSSSSRRRS